MKRSVIVAFACAVNLLLIEVNVEARPQRGVVGVTASIAASNSSVAHGEQHTAGPSAAPMGPALQGPNGNSSASACSAAAVIGMTPTELLKYLGKADYNCLYFLWQYEPALASIFTDNHVKAVLAAIEQKLPRYTGNNNTQLLEHMSYVRVFYYYASWQHPAFVGRNVAAETVRALDAFSASAHVNDFNSDAARITAEWIAAADGASLGYRYMPLFVSMLADFNDPRQHRLADYYQQINAWLIEAQLWRGLWNGDANIVASVDAALIRQLEAVALQGTLLTSDGTYVIDNAIYALGLIVDVTRPGNPPNITAPSYLLWKQALYALSAILDYHQYLSGPYLWVVRVVNDFSDCNLPMFRRPICRAVVVPQVERIAFPNHYEFDDGAMTFDTPLSDAVVQPLYQASKVVRAQFNRVTETILPVAGDPNRVLTVKVYGSRDDYIRYQPFLYGLDTNNGGIYIEQSGTFYTYDRTVAQSSYTLEELFRHEYSHYLVGRWLIPDMWGATAIYDNNRLVWFDEGFAEFLAWSSVSDGVRVRRTLVDLVQRDGANRMSVNELLGASYASFGFYRYAGLFFNHLYDSDPGTLRQLLALVRGLGTVNGRVAFDAFVAQMRGDVALNSAFQNSLDQWIANISALDDPSTALAPLSALSTGDTSLIQADFRATRLGLYAECFQMAWQRNARFVCSDSLVGPVVATTDATEAWQAFDGDLDEILNELKQVSVLNNMQGVTCSLGPIAFASYGSGHYAYAPYFCEGPLAANSSVAPDPVTRAQAVFQSTRLGTYATCSVGATATQSTCSLWSSTQWHTTSSSQTALDGELAASLAELTNTVYAADPTVDLSCDFDGVGYFDSALHYAARPVVCTVN